MKRGRQWVLWHGDATQLRPSYLQRSRPWTESKHRQRTESKTEMKEERVHERGLFTRSGPITVRDGCYLFIILLNVDRPGAKATGSYLPGSPYCSEIFVWLNERVWAPKRFDCVSPDDSIMYVCKPPLPGMI